jgi:hypothetical protein
MRRTTLLVTVGVSVLALLALDVCCQVQAHSSLILP